MTPRTATFADAPILVIGNPRSGTTLLRLMLTCHPRICIPPEGEFLLSLYPKYARFAGEPSARTDFARDALAAGKMETWDLPVASLERYLERREPRTYAELAAGVYGCYAHLHEDDKELWGDKNNFHLHYVRELSGLFPGARFLHIVRDGRDVACSYRDLAGLTGEYAPRLPGGVLGAAIHWRDNLLAARSGFAAVGWDRICELRYEDLVRSPEAVLGRVCAFLGVDYSRDMLEFSARNRREGLEPSAFDAWKSRTREGLTTSQVERWRNEMRGDQVSLFQGAAGGLLHHYGYPLQRGVGGRAAVMHGIGWGGAWLARLPAAAKRLRRRLGRLRHPI